MKNTKGISKALIILSVISIVMAAIVNITQTTIWIAGTQWILIGVTLAIYAMYLGGCGCGCCIDKDKQ